MTTIQAFIKKHPVLSYYALTFALSWGGMLLVIRGNGGLPPTQEEFARQVALAIPAMLGGPSVACLLVTALVAGKAGFRELFSRLRRWRVGAGWYAVALLTAPLLFLVVHAALSLASSVFLPGVVTTADKAPFLLTSLAAALMVGFFEELGWTGFAIPRLRLRHSVLATGLIAGVLWAAWHAPVIRGWPSVALSGGLSVPLFAAVSGALVLVGQLPAYRVLMAWVYDRTGSLLVAMLMHASLTASTFILGPAVISGTDLLVYDVALGAAWWVVVAVVAVANHGQLSRQPLQWRMN
jgi:membrane protease YdiL (CAAX protease family)